MLTLVVHTASTGLDEVSELQQREAEKQWL
jgi:hypothetical protein